MQNQNFNTTKEEKVCSICQNQRYVIRTVKDKPFLTLCSCITNICETCSGDRKAPYFYYDFTNKKLLSCPCRSIRMKLDAIQGCYKRSNVPKKYLYNFLDSFQIQKTQPNIYKSLLILHDKARHFINNFSKLETNKRGIFYYGAPGVGKTKLMCIILNELIIRYQTDVRFMKVTRDFFQKIRHSYSNSYINSDTSYDIFNSIANTELLAIDDLGVQLDSTWELSTVYDLIDYRYENNKPTLITSNYEPQDFQQLFNGRIYSRLQEMMQWQEIVASDYREQYREDISV